MPNEANLHPMWAEEYWKLKTFFENDPTVKVGDVVAKRCTITFNNSQKADYFKQLINLHELSVDVRYEAADISNNEKLAYVCDSNSLYHDYIKKEMDDGKPIFEAVEFEPVCTHWFSDDMFSPSGHTAILPWQLAKDLFGGNGINFQTYLTEEDLGINIR